MQVLAGYDTGARVVICFSYRISDGAFALVRCPRNRAIFRFIPFVLHGFLQIFRAARAVQRTVPTAFLLQEWTEKMSACGTCLLHTCAIRALESWMQISLLSCLILDLLFVEDGQERAFRTRLKQSCLFQKLWPFTPNISEVHSMNGKL